MHNFKYFFREGAGNMLSHGFMSFAAVGVTVACLLIMGTFSLVAYNANINLQDLQKENAVVAFVDESLTDDEATALQSRLAAIPGVADCTFASRQEARDEYVAQYNEDDLYSDLDPSIFRHRYVMHLTSVVKGELLDRVSSLDALKSTLPAGTVSGAPKIRAMQRIYELEKTKRGIYAGAIGYLSSNSDMDFAIALRTMVLKDGKAHAQAGAGIVFDSVPESEYQETLNKAKAMTKIGESNDFIS